MIGNDCGWKAHLASFGYQANVEPEMRSNI